LDLKGTVEIRDLESTVLICDPTSAAKSPIRATRQF
jgi:hypothetical protein